MSLPADLLRSFARTPVNRLLGLRLLEREPGRCEVALDPAEEHLQEGGVVHGGILTTLADTTAVYTLLPELPPERSLTSIELKLNFLRPGRAADGEIRARAALVQGGRRVALVDVELDQAGKLIAKGLFTYLMLDLEQPRASSWD